MMATLRDCFENAGEAGILLVIRSCQRKRPGVEPGLSIWWTVTRDYPIVSGLSGTSYKMSSSGWRYQSGNASVAWRTVPDSDDPFSRVGASLN
jgi:hypothetical protein